MAWYLLKTLEEISENNGKWHVKVKEQAEGKVDEKAADDGGCTKEWCQTCLLQIGTKNHDRKG